jgi:hypothetical protein
VKSNRIMWGVVALFVLLTIAVSFGTTSSYSQKETPRETPKEQSKTPFWDFSKYPVVDLNAPESSDVSERELRKIKNKRYDNKPMVTMKPRPDSAFDAGSHPEVRPPAIPFSLSTLVVIGEIVSSKASLSNDKKAVYSEYSVKLQTILKPDKDKDLTTGEFIDVDRTGGIVQYPNGQKILYYISNYPLPEVNARYLFFLTRDDDTNPNYSILTAYQLKNGVVTALDGESDFRKLNGMMETEFINLVLEQKQETVNAMDFWRLPNMINLLTAVIVTAE